MLDQGLTYRWNMAAIRLPTPSDRPLLFLMDDGSIIEGYRRSYAVDKIDWDDLGYEDSKGNKVKPKAWSYP
jgi:hypothetical protein